MFIVPRASVGVRVGVVARTLIVGATVVAARVGARIDGVTTIDGRGNAVGMIKTVG
jgi:hypothetical protein